MQELLAGRSLESQSRIQKMVGEVLYVEVMDGKLHIDVELPIGKNIGFNM